VDVEPGEFVCVTGPSGSGKSTFMHILGCLDRPTAASTSSTARMSRKCRATSWRRSGTTGSGSSSRFQSALEDERHRERRTALLYSRDHIKASERHKRARSSLEIVGLLERSHHHPNQLSGGQQQRVAIARALINNPSILLADEPTGNLDSRTSIEVMDVFQRLNVERGITILLITHEHDIAEYGTRTIAFRDGHIVRDAANEHRRMAKDELAALPRPK